MSILSDNIKTIREHTALSGEAFAKKYGTKLPALQSYEQGRVKNPSPVFIGNLCEQFGISTTQIFKERLTAEQLQKKIKPSEYSIVHVKLEAAEQRIKDLEYTIQLQKQLLLKK